MPRTTAAPANSAVYSASKAALDAITRVLCKELGPRKIRVNSVNPGMISTEGTRAGGFVGTELEKAVVALPPLGRLGTVDEISTVVSFLASDEAQWVTGELIVAGGGLR
jgi:3-oxoacyl-[acyl-carrier protein] reductase